MYGRQGIEITLADDGSFTVEVSIENPAKAKEKKNGPYVESTLHKTLTAKDVKEVTALIDQYLPGITKTASKEGEEFDKAFKKAAEEKD